MPVEAFKEKNKAPKQSYGWINHAVFIIRYLLDMNTRSSLYFCAVRSHLCTSDFSTEAVSSTNGRGKPEGKRGGVRGFCRSQADAFTRKQVLSKRGTLTNGRLVFDSNECADDTILSRDASSFQKVEVLPRTLEQPTTAKLRMRRQWPWHVSLIHRMAQHCSNIQNLSVSF